MRRLAVWVLVGVFAVGAVVAGRVAWGWYTRHRTVPPTTALNAQCDEVPEGAERVTLTATDGQVLGGTIVGPADATVGVVLRQGASQTICEWLPWAGDLSEATGSRVLLFDRRGRGSSPGEGNLSAEPGDTAVAVERLRADGVRRVVLAGSSMGNSIMFSTLPDLAPAPCAVVSISPVLVSSDGHGVVDGTSLRALPANLWVTWEAQNPNIEHNVDLIRDAAAAQGNPAPHELGVDTMDHSRQLVLHHAEVRDLLVEAVSSCADPP
jgi:pimeloyl-ACP methyl ester carboxylesterase